MVSNYQTKLMTELLPSAAKDFLAIFTPYLLAITEVIPIGLAIFTGVLSVMHLFKKYKLTSLQLKAEQKRELEEKRKSLENV